MAEEWVSIKIKKSTRDRLVIDCKEEFLKHHKDFKGMYLTPDFILQKIETHYLETP